MMNYYGRHDKFDEYIDEFYPPVDIAGVSMLASNVLFFTDRIAYDVALSDWESEQEEEEEEDDEPNVCSAEDAWDDWDERFQSTYPGGREEFIKGYNELNNL